MNGPPMAPPQGRVNEAAPSVFPAPCDATKSGDMARTQRLLVTGFGAFPGVPDNPTARLMDWLQDSREAFLCRRLQIETAVLPVEWHAGPEHLHTLLAEHDPDVALHFGANRNAVGFRIEQWARNTTSHQADARGAAAPASTVLADAPRALRAPLSAIKVARHLRSLGLPAQASRDGGRYLCNTVYFLSLLAARPSGRPRLVQFVHIPDRLHGDDAAHGRLTWQGLRRGTSSLIALVAGEAARMELCPVVAPALAVTEAP